MKKALTVVIAFLTLVCNCANAGVVPPQVEWLRVFDKRANDEHGEMVQETTDNGFIVVGSQSPYEGDYGIILIKTDAQGNEIWSQIFSFPESYSGSVLQTQDNGYIILASCCFLLPEDNPHSMLIKTDSEGNELWRRRVGEEDHCYSIIRKVGEGGYVIAGMTIEENICLIRIDHEGNELWARTFGGARKDEAHAVEPTQDGGFIIAGCTHSFADSGTPDIYLIKTDSEGLEVWSRVFSYRESDHAHSVQQTQDGGYIINAGTYSAEEGSNVNIIKTDADGNEVWSRILDEGYGGYVIQTADGGYVIFEGFSIVKLDFEGNIIYSSLLPDIGESDGITGWFIVRDLIQVSDGGYIVAGSYEENSDCLFQIFLAKFTPESTAQFIRGDANGDEKVNISDAVYTLHHLFGNQECKNADAMDANDDGTIDIADPIYTLDYLFTNGPQPPAPFPNPGVDSTADELSCLR